jgi:hypothetical protein
MFPLMNINVEFQKLSDSFPSIKPKPITIRHIIIKEAAKSTDICIGQ